MGKRAVYLVWPTGGGGTHWCSRLPIAKDKPAGVQRAAQGEGRRAFEVQAQSPRCDDIRQDMRARYPSRSTRACAREIARAKRSRECEHERAVDGAATIVRSTIATIARRPVSKIASNQALRGDLAFDSLMLLELLVAIETELGRSLDAERVASAQTVGDVEAFVREAQSARRLATTQSIEKEDALELDIPEPLREAAMAWMGRRSTLYDRVLRPGAGRVVPTTATPSSPQSRQSPRMGLVKYALAVRENMVSLRTGHFSSNKTQAASNFTNRRPCRAAARSVKPSVKPAICWRTARRC